LVQTRRGVHIWAAVRKSNLEINVNDDDVFRPFRAEHMRARANSAAAVSTDQPKAANLFFPEFPRFLGTF
jgi:hypothetical protein